MDPDRTSRASLGVALGGLGTIFVAGGLVGIRGEIANVNVALILVLVVLGAASFGGRSAGAMSGLVAAMAFDFFHTRPYGSLKIAGANDLITTLLLLVVGLVMGEVAERSNRFKHRLRDDEAHLRRLHRVAKAAASGEQDDRDLVLSVAAELMDTLRLDDCHFERPPFVTDLPRLDPDGPIAGSSFRSAHGGYELPSGGADLRVVGRKGIVGRYILVTPPGVQVSSERLLVAVTLAHELGATLAPGAS